MGGYADLPPEERPGYVPPQPVNTNNTPPGGIPGVKYSERMVPSFTPYPQWGPNGVAGNTAVPGQAPRSLSGTTGYSAPSGSYKYADPPATFSYTAKPVVETAPPAIPHTRKPSKGRNGTFPTAAPLPYAAGAATQYQTATVAPGQPPQATPYPSGPGMYPTSQMPPPPPMPPGPGLPYGIEGVGPDGQVPQGRAYAEGARIMEIAPRDSPSPPSKSKSKSKSSKSSSHRLSASGPRPELRAPSPGPGLGVRTRMDRLSVSGDRPDYATIAPAGAMPPPSPLLEPYRGTWQSMPRMPSPMVHPIEVEYDRYDEIDYLEPLSPRQSGASIQLGRTRSISISKPGRSVSRQRSVSARRSVSPKKKDRPKKSVSMYEAERDAGDIAAELTHAKPDFGILTDILPALSHDQILELHTAYKHVAKFQGRGINIAKHIKLKVTGHLRTVAYVTALGRWESEGYWANYWYQSNTAKRELLIESLMGRTNAEIRLIKGSFRDKRYGDSLVRCMDKELRADKFRSAILMALEEKRQEENDVWPKEYVDQDVDTWARSLRRREGGETALLEICVGRSERHLRECLKVYERREGGNFAKLALERSGNLVVRQPLLPPLPLFVTNLSLQGEVIAHILNGVINRPARDAMLLHHAITDLAPAPEPSSRPPLRRGSSSSESNSDSRPSNRRDKDPSPRASVGKILNPFAGGGARDKDPASAVSKKDRKDRYELLISRVVRLHWDRQHLRRVKDEYHEKYGRYVEDDIEDNVKAGEFMEFCLGLLESH